MSLPTKETWARPEARIERAHTLAEKLLKRLYIEPPPPPPHESVRDYVEEIRAILAGEI